MCCPPDYSGAPTPVLSPGGMPKETRGPEGWLFSAHPSSARPHPGWCTPTHLCDRVGFMELMELRGGCMGSFPGGSLWRLF